MSRAPPGGQVAEVRKTHTRNELRPFFVHRDPAAAQAGTADIDDGFLICYVTNKKTNVSYCKVCRNRFIFACSLCGALPVGRP